MQNSCALDIAEDNDEGLPLGTLGEILNLTRERVRQIEVEAREKLEEIDLENL